MTPLSFLLSANASVYSAVQGKWVEGEVWTNRIDTPARLPPRMSRSLVDKYLVLQAPFCHLRQSFLETLSEDGESSLPEC